MMTGNSAYVYIEVEKPKINGEDGEPPVE